MNKPGFHFRLTTFFIFLLALCSRGEELFGQEYQEVYGEISANPQLDFQVNIINISQHQGTVSKTDGSYKIKAAKGDELIFSVIGYEVVEVKITDSVMNNLPLNLQLKQKNNYLDEVHLSNNNLTGNLTKDVSAIQVFDQSKLGLPMRDQPKMTVPERKLHALKTVPPGASLKVPLDYLLGLISGDVASLKKQIEYEKMQKDIDFITEILNRESLHQTLKIPKDKIEDFLYFCIEDKDLRSGKKRLSVLELNDFVKQKAEIYLNRLEEN